MEKIDFALLGDGSSDRCLLPILKWSLRHHFPGIPINGAWADLSRFDLPSYTLSMRIRTAAELYQPDILFVHRDAESQDPQLRYDQIANAIDEIIDFSPEYVCVVPVRMTEAWLLFDERALRVAAGNPHGRVRINVPSLQRVEALPDPKRLLKDLLIEASELSGRHRKRFQPDKCRYLITENIDDFSPLFALGAFQRLDRNIETLANR